MRQFNKANKQLIKVFTFTLHYLSFGNLFFDFRNY
jgi:hypothetical protein